MSRMNELLEKHEQLVNEREVQKNNLKKKDEELDRVTEQIKELKEQNDYGSFKFILSNMPVILQKIAPKHKVPHPRDIELTSDGSSTTMVASVPLGEPECSDTNLSNINVCPRCTLLHFQTVMSSLLAEYYTK